MLTLKNFEKQIPAVILKKGEAYYLKGAVKSLEETDENIWEAEVRGSNDYEVEIEIKNNNQIGDYFCDCPFEGEICKHIVAALYAMRGEIKGTGPLKSKVSQKGALESLLQKVTQKEYQDFIRQYALKNKAFKTEFEIWFADKDDKIDLSEKYEKLIKKIVRDNSDGGFVDYRSTHNLTHEIEKILTTGINLIDKNNYRDAFALAKPVLKSMMELIPNSDDSNGSIGGIIDEAGNLIGTIAGADKTAPELKEQIFIFLKTELNKKIYFDYGDFGYDLFSIFQSLALQLAKEKEFLAFINAQMTTASSYYETYHNEYFQKRKIEFLKSIGKTEDADKLTAENLDIVEVRQGEVNKAIEKKDFASAKKLIADGIKIAEEKKHPGTVSEWEKDLLRIAVLEKDTSAIRHYTKKFAFDRWFNASYYTQWKETYPPSDWTGIIENHIEETITKVKEENIKNRETIWYSPLLSVIAPVYIEEKMWDRLLALIKKEKQLEKVWPYHGYLAKSYPNELIEIYLPLLESAGDDANGRSAYADLASKMKKVVKDIPDGKEKIIGVAQKLKQKYPRRPAMVEELNTLLK